jgi:predicted HTH transcriptional regulator
MEQKEVKKLVAKKEGATLEFKPGLSEPDRIVEVVCSFACQKGDMKGT